MESFRLLVRLACCAVLILPIAQPSSAATLVQHQCSANKTFHCFTVVVAGSVVAGVPDGSFEVLVAPAQSKARGLPILVAEALGEAGTDAAPDGLIQSLAPLNRTHDLVFVDQRGVSGSLVLRCPVLDPSAALAPYARSFYDRDAIRACAGHWKGKIDLGSLNAVTFAADLEAVRQGLGYGRIELVGYFYGTRIVEEYLRRFGAQAAAALLVDVAVPGVSVAATQLLGQDRAIERIEHACLASSVCNARFPTLAEDFTWLNHQFARGSSFPSEITHDGMSEQVVLSADVVRGWLGSAATRVNSAPSVPGAIHALAGSDSSKLIFSVLSSRRAIQDSVPLAEIVAVRCNEDERSQDTSGTDARLQEFYAACDVWPHSQPASGVAAALQSIVAILGVTAEDDLAAPAGPVHHFFAALSNARLVVLPGRSRAADYDWDACLKPMSVTFLEGMSPGKVDVRCAKDLKSPDF